MRQNDAWQLACDLMDRHGVGHWNFAFDRAKKRCGSCSYREERISLSVHYVENNPEESVRNTILHEIAHALVGPGHHHDAVWRAMAGKIGAKPERCITNAVMPEGEWVAMCACGYRTTRHRRPKCGRTYYHSPCGPAGGVIKWRKE